MLTVKLNRKPLDKSFSNLVDSFFTELPSVFKNDFNGSETKSWVPVNVQETDKAYRMEVIAPGFEKSDFSISLEEDLLTVSAEKKQEVKEETRDRATHLRREYAFRSFKRTFTLDEKIDATLIEASYINGVLTLNLPKKAEVKPPVTEITVK